MARGRKKKKRTIKSKKVKARNKAFGQASRECMAEKSTWGAFGSCMRAKLGGKKRKK